MNKCKDCKHSYIVNSELLRYTGCKKVDESSNISLRVLGEEGKCPYYSAERGIDKKKVTVTIQDDLKMIEVDGRVVITSTTLSDEDWINTLKELGCEVEVIHSDDNWYNIITTNSFYISDDSGNSNGRFIKILEDNFRFIKIPDASRCYGRIDYECKIYLESMNDFIRLKELLGEELILNNNNHIEIYDDYRE